MAGDTATAADSIKIGCFDSLTGPFGNVGDASHRHFQYMNDIFNARGGGLGGKKFEIVAFASKFSPKQVLGSVSFSSAFGRIHLWT